MARALLGVVDEGHEARIKNLEQEVNRLRDRSHKFAAKIQTSAGLLGVVKNLTHRVQRLEKWKAKLATIIGIIAGVCFVIGYILS